MSVDPDVAVGDHLAGGGAGVGKAEMIDDVVEAGLEDLQHLLAGDAAAVECASHNAAKLALEQAVLVTELLLLDEADGVIGVLAAGLGAVHAGTVVAAFQSFGRAENRDSETAADAGAGTCVTSHIKFTLRFDVDVIRRGVFCAGGSRCAGRA